MGFVRKHSVGGKKTKRAAHAGVRLAKISAVGRDEDWSTGNEVEMASAASPAHTSAVSDPIASVMELAQTYAYEEIPDEVLVGIDIDLSMWSVVARDSCMERLGARKRQRARGKRGAPSSANQLADTLVEAASSGASYPPPAPAAIQRLNLQGAEHITDQGLRTIGGLCPNLTSLNVERATKLTDLGLRHLVNSCRHLQAVHVSYIPSLRSIALAAMADCHLPLRVLSLAGCPHIPDFALQRVLLACGTTLERLDLSYCDDSVTDNTLLAIGQHCASGHLQSLRLRGCRQISDAGVVHLTAACARLAVLDLTRFDLAYKLNDIALLSLAEKCVLLQTVQLSGCESLTDVGVSWLASGCPGITHLELGGCAKLTDIALRAIGENLLRLRHLSVKNCVRISDLGLRHLALGCPQLSYLDLAGLILLSDPQTSSVPVGVAAVASQCSRLHHLDLSRCPCIGDGTLLALASNHHEARYLATVNLAGCARATSRGVRALLAKCHNELTSLSLQGCVRVTDHAFESCRGTDPPLVLPLLAVLRLRDCESITDASIRAIVQAKAPLKELDLTGSVHLTDLAILALTQSPTVSSTLRCLWLRDVVQISDTALSWLAECCPKLLFLDLTGCSKIRAFSLRALASSWKFATYTSGFKGIKPIHRAEDRLFIEEYGDCWRAATRIQSLFRARVARRIAAQRREEQLQVWVATRLQSVYRGRQARRLAVVRRLELNKETEAARRIQARYRQRLARAEVMRLRAERYEEQRESAARSVQLAWRRKRLRERLTIREVRRRNEERRVEQAATKLQRLWRGKHARDRVSVLRAAKLAREREQNEAANKMQNVYRMRAARREANAKRDQKRQLERQQEQAALLLQRHARRHHAQLELARRKREKQRVETAARRIQRKWRAKKRNCALQLAAFSKQQKREHDAAVKLQASWKRKKGRDAMKLLKVIKQAEAQRVVDSAVRVQLAWRNKVAHREAMLARQARLDIILEQLRLHNRCAALIQSHFRGRRGREQYRALVLSRKKQRWKEIVHPDTGKPFYYNKETGEVRFRRPQDVLDLLPKPPCDNCVPPEVSLAQVECQDCEELYCNTCWRNVHAGGRRKGHAFRVLYDFYERRVDYGDGEFPSRWPSEIRQDEMDGWSLRTYPLRTPVESRGPWEKYEVDNTPASGGHSWWYYNKETEANSYVAPPAWTGESGSAEYKPTDQALESDASGWAKYVDNSTGNTYYYNAATGETTYERPLSFLTPRASDAYVERSADGWTKYADATTGAAYYYNASTGESTYTRPVTFLTPRRGQVPVEKALTGAGGDGWAKYYDDAQGVYYYYNAWTRTSSNERPVRFQTPRVGASDVAAGLQQHVYVDATSQQQYAYDAQTTECRAVVTTTTSSPAAARDSRMAAVQRGYR